MECDDIYRDGFKTLFKHRYFIYPTIFLLFARFSTLFAQAPTATVETAQGHALSSSFRCPEDYSSVDAKQAALRDFMQAYSAEFPNNNVRDLIIYRYRLLVAHSCVQTLKFMLADVSPTSEMLSLQNVNYGPKTEEFDTATKVWTIYFKKDGEPPALSDEELIFNFYGWKPATSPEAIAQAFIAKRDNVKILGKFQAPDDLTKEPAYFIVSQTLYPGQTYGYLKISKVTSVGSGAYTITFSKKFTAATASGAEEKGRTWFLSMEGKATASAVGRIGVDGAWEAYLSNRSKR